MEISDAELHALVLRVNRAFYERVYRDEWLSLVFRSVPQKHIENQQTDFIVSALGGPRRYMGRAPRDAHPHIAVSEEMWNLRERLLREALEEVGAPQWLREKWMKIDGAFKPALLRRSEDCKRRFTTDDIIDVPDPRFRRAG
jgi:hemoglobin